MYIKDVQDTLRRLKNTNISQGDIAKAINTTRSNVSQLFAKNSDLDEDKIKKIESYFNVELNSDASFDFIKVPIYQDQMQQTKDFICLSKKESTDRESIFAIKVSTNSMSPYINKGDIAVFNKNFEKIEDGKIFLIKFKNNLYIKRILNNMSTIILKSDNKDYTDIVIDSFKTDEIEILGALHSIIRYEN